MTALALPAGQCTTCGSPAGTVTRAEGDPAWLADFLTYLGLPRDRAQAAASAAADGLEPGEWLTLLIPVCPQCALPAGVRTALDIDGLDVPVTRQQEGGQP